MCHKENGHVFSGYDQLGALEGPQAAAYGRQSTSTYIHHPPVVENISGPPPAINNVEGAKILALLGDSVTTDHISPAGNIKTDSPAGRYLREQGVEPRDFNSYGDRKSTRLNSSH